MTLQFQADADLNQAIVSGIIRRQAEIDIQASNITNLEGLSDIEVLQLAASLNRVLISHDQRTMPIHFAEFIETYTSSGVIIILQSLSVRDAINGLIHIWQHSKPDDWINRIAYLPL